MVSSVFVNGKHTRSKQFLYLIPNFRHCSWIFSGFTDFPNVKFSPKKLAFLKNFKLRRDFQIHEKNGAQLCQSRSPRYLRFLRNLEENQRMRKYFFSREIPLFEELVIMVTCGFGTLLSGYPLGHGDTIRGRILFTRSDQKLYQCEAGEQIEKLPQESGTFC